MPSRREAQHLRSYSAHEEGTADRDIFAWRQLAWDNAQRLMAAPTLKAREAIAKEIRKHARDKAREILHWYR
jgi:hypothetical protein